MDDDLAQADTPTPFSRPRYFHGQLLDVRHFESEQSYFRRKQWMLNRLISGFGVVCGLDVQVGDDEHSVVVLSGVALDRRGREIVVPTRSRPVPIPSRPPPEGGGEGSGEGGGYGGPAGGGSNGSPGARPGYSNQGRDDDCEGDDDWVHLVICYDECRTDPEPVLSGGCDGPERCAPGAVREGYELSLEPGKAPDTPVDCRIPNLLKGNNVNYRALAEWVSTPCERMGGPCLALANIRLPTGDGTVEPSQIDISVRPIVYGLDLLWELVLSLSHETQGRRTGKY